MCSLFATTDASALVHKALIDSCLARRGTQEVVWEQTSSGSVAAHCLLPVRGSSPVFQPIPIDGKILLYSGELWDVEQGKSDTIELLDRIRKLGFKKAIKRSQGM